MRTYMYFSLALLIIFSFFQVNIALAEEHLEVGVETDTSVETDITGDLGLESETSVETEISVEQEEEEADQMQNETESITTSKPKSSEGLVEIMTAIALRLEAKQSEAAFCQDLTSVYSSLSADAKSTLAWSIASYEGILETKVSSSVSGAHSALFAQAVIDAREAREILEQLDGEDEARIMQAFVRSALLSYVRELSRDEVDSNRIDRIVNFLERATTCLQGAEALQAKIETLVARWRSAKEHLSADTLPEDEAATVETKYLLFYESTRDDEAGTPPDEIRVVTEEDFRAYVDAFVARNPQVEKVVVMDGKLRVIYRSPGKLLGFIPVTMNTKAEVSRDDVKIRFPWYGFLTSKMRILNEENLEESLLTEDAAVEDEPVSEEVDETTTIRSFIEQHIAALNALSLELEASANMDMEAETDTEAEVGEEVQEDESGEEEGETEGENLNESEDTVV